MALNINDQLSEMVNTSYYLMENCDKLPINSDERKRSYVLYIHNNNRFEWFKFFNEDVYREGYVSPIINMEEDLYSIRNNMISLSKRMLWAIKRLMYKGLTNETSIIKGSIIACRKFYQETSNVNYLLCSLHACFYVHLSILTGDYNPIYWGIPNKINNMKEHLLETETMVKYIDILKSLNNSSSDN